jgi:hypothetical protein
MSLLLVLIKAYFRLRPYVFQVLLFFDSSCFRPHHMFFKFCSFSTQVVLDHNICFPSSTLPSRHVCAVASISKVLFDIILVFLINFLKQYFLGFDRKNKRIYYTTTRVLMHVLQ